MKQYEKISRATGLSPEEVIDILGLESANEDVEEEPYNPAWAYIEADAKQFADRIVSGVLIGMLAAFILIVLLKA